MTIKELKEKVLNTSIINEVIGSYVPLKRKGKDFVGLCPFHDEKSPSFIVTPAKAIYKCFGCGASGDVITFIEKHQNLTFLEALNLLAHKQNIPVTFDNERQKKTDYQSQLQSVKCVDKQVLTATLNHYNINHLFMWLQSVVGFEKAYTAMLKFYTGTAKDGSTIYWQVDQFLRIRTAQKIKYDGTGHRIKAITPLRLYTQTDGYKPCFFGEHQLLEADNQTVIGMVESEKTAIICSIYMPYVDGNKIIYLACSGSNGMTEEKAWVLRGMKVCLIPDFSFTARAVWGLTEMRRKEINNKQTISEDGEIDTTYISIAARLQALNCSISFLDPCPHVKDGTDIADILIKHPPVTVIEMPNFDDLELIPTGFDM